MSSAKELLLDFLNSAFGLFVLGSVLLPLILGLITRYREHVAELTKRDLLTRVAIFRYRVIQQLYWEASEAGEGLEASLGQAYGALLGSTPYIPLLPDIEANVPLSGLLLRILPKKELRGVAIPQPISNLQELKDLLGKVVLEDSIGIPKRWEQHSQDIDRVMKSVAIDAEKCSRLL